MKELSIDEANEISGGFKINIGQAIAGCVFGFVTGGPVGLGYAVSVLLMAQGINNLDEMYHNEFRQ